MHKCDGCRYKGEYHEMMFRPVPVCNRGANLLEGIKNYDAKKCPYQKTNGDRIRAMSDEELAHFLADRFGKENCHRLYGEGRMLTATQITEINHTWYCHWMQWLKQKAEE